MRTYVALWLFLEYSAARARRRRRQRSAAIPLVELGPEIYWLSNEGPVHLATWKDPAA